MYRILRFLFIFQGFLSAQPITLEDLWLKNRFALPASEELPASWTADGKEFIRFDKSPHSQNLGVQLYLGINQQWSRTLVDANTLLKLTGDSAILDPDHIMISPGKRFLIFQLHTSSVYRRSTIFQAWLYDCKKQTIFQIQEGQWISVPEFSANDQYISYVSQQNLYIYDLTVFKTKQITFDGSRNQIINGQTDWVYEEEFEFTKAHYFDRSGKSLCWLRFDETNVPEVELPYMGQEAYPVSYAYKYPKAGYEASKVKILSFQLGTGAIDTLQWKDTNVYYIPRILQSSEFNGFIIQTLNRHQNKLSFWLYMPEKKSLKYLFADSSASYVEVTNDVFALKRTPGFIFTSERSGQRQLYVYRYDLNTIEKLTSHKSELCHVVGVDDQDRVYLQVYGNKTYHKEIVVYQFKTQSLTPICPSKRGVYSAEMSPDCRMALIQYSDGSSIPRSQFWNTSTPFRLKDKPNPEPFLKVNQPVFFELRLKQQSFSAWMMKPFNFDSSKKYPVLFYVYGGPGSQEVLDEWGGYNQIWFSMLNQKGILVICVDGRGTAARGSDFKKCTYLKLGIEEAKDQINLAHQIAQWPYVDAKKMAIWGWSFGGYLSLMSACMPNSPFAAALSVAPVTDWRWYDNIYTERFMRTPLENSKGYDSSSVFTWLEHLKAPVFLAHGMFDDNVHPQHSMVLLNAMIEKQKKVEPWFYPDKAHGIGGKKTRYHLYGAMTRFLEKTILTDFR